MILSCAQTPVIFRVQYEIVIYDSAIDVCVDEADEWHW